MTKALRTARGTSILGRLRRSFCSTQLLAPASCLPPHKSLGLSLHPRPSPARSAPSLYRTIHTEDATSPRQKNTAAVLSEAALPLSCPGCGALTQWIDPQEAGFYSIWRKPVKAYISSRAQAPVKVPDQAYNLEHDIQTSIALSPEQQSLIEPPHAKNTGTYRVRSGSRLLRLTLP